MKQDVGTEIIKILKNDPQAVRLMAEMNAKANECGISNEQYKKAREFVILLSMRNNPEAMDLMFKAVYEAAKMEAN